VLWIRIRISIHFGLLDADPDPGGPMTHKSEENINFEVLDVLF
jgi:hypothetical protein